MGRAKDLWVDEIDRVCSSYAVGALTREAAMLQLFHLGLDHDEAEGNLIAAAESVDFYAQK